jgi:hypothetical protein
MRGLSEKMKLIHYSGEEIKDLELKDYSQETLRWQAKPNGLWVSVEGEAVGANWKEWCEAEGYWIECLVNSYEIHLHENANILHLKTPEEMREFTKKYPYLREQWNDPVGRDICKSYELNWNEVKKNYQAIIISPYQWECRVCLKTSWYYGWDCSSGCIWDLECIKEFKRI